MFPFSPLSPFRFVSCVYFQCVCSLEVMQKAVRALGERCGGCCGALLALLEAGTASVLAAK